MKFIGARLGMPGGPAFLWVCAGIFWPPFSYFRQGAALRLDASDPSNTLAYAVFAAFLLVVAIARRDDLLGALRSAWPILALIALAYLSAFWSDAPELV